MRSISFRLDGAPVEQGNHRSSPTGHVYESNPRMKPHREALVGLVAEKIEQLHRPVWIGPVTVAVTFFFPRPAAHYGTGANARRLKPTAPTYPIVKPDVDKLQRLVGDALGSQGALLIRDDSQIVQWHATKVYCADGEAPRTEIRVAEVAEVRP